MARPIVSSRRRIIVPVRPTRTRVRPRPRRWGLCVRVLPVTVPVSTWTREITRPRPGRPLHMRRKGRVGLLVVVAHIGSGTVRWVEVRMWVSVGRVCTGWRRGRPILLVLMLMMV